MKDLKIRVNSEAESKEAQELFFELGYHWAYRSIGKNIYYEKKDIYLYAYKRGNLVAGTKENQVHFNSWCGTLVSLPQLRDLVVLKRNNVGDATHTDPNEKASLYFRLFGEWWNLFTGGKWQKFCHMESPRAVKLKPIEKPMKEYLRKNSDGTYSYIGTVRPEHVSDFMIEIPEGAQVYAVNNGYHYFFSSAGIGFEWSVVWQRHTHPEELPFIDDEPKIETATGYQLDVGSNTYGSRSRYDGESDISYRQYLMNFIVGNGTESINNQYAEIEKVRQSHRTASETSNPTIKETLNQRQSQYGSFEDVAMITEQMVDVMRKGYYENLAYNQKMALYMICSKMARIVNGNPNHKDSWHDIAGYATLIDNELVSEKDMPF